jgi:hypothetical protein
MFAEISSAVASAKIALDIAKTAHGLANYNELVSAVSEVNTKLMQVTAVSLAGQEKQAALAAEIAELKEKLRNVEDWESQIQQYSLQALPTGALAHGLKPDMNNGQPPHYICTTCVGNRKKTILQPKGRALYCTACNKSILIQDSPPHNYSPIGGGTPWG